MSSWKSSIPAPKYSYKVHQDPSKQSKTNGNSIETPVKAKTVHIPPYGKRAKNFVPRGLEDYGDGGAYPEVHVAQFPLNMGRKDSKRNNVLSVTVNKDGEASFDAIAKRGHNAKTKVYSAFTDLVEKDMRKRDLQKPTEEEEQETTQRTKEALEKLVSGKISSSKPVNISRQKTALETSSYYRYTPNPNAPGYNPEIKQRVVRMVEAPVDPMEPPKFKHTKAPRGPGSPPVPVLHSPPRKLTVKDQQNFKIPPCVSNWKNAKGYTISIAQRLAADGRGLQEVTINDKFASFAESLAIAERKAREEVNYRAQVQKKLVMKEKELKEAELRDLASRSRMERAGMMKSEEHNSKSSRRSRSPSTSSSSSSENEHETEKERKARQERDRIRRERKREREREMRMEKLGKKGKLARDDDRDVSEKIALGQLQGTGANKGSGDGAMFDSRLFNQSQGISSGFGQDDDYNVYSKPLSDRKEASVYRPKVSGDDMYGSAENQMNELRKTDRFRPDRQFQGTSKDPKEGGGKRDGPVQFEKEQDPFGLDQFLDDARKGKKAMENIGKSGGMAASASAGSREAYEEQSYSSKNRKLNFQSGSSRESRR